MSNRKLLLDALELTDNEPDSDSESEENTNIMKILYNDLNTVF